jgi:hypothetical protein
MLDLGGDQIYHHLYPNFLSTIDHSNESTLFCIVYNHTSYTNLNYHKQIGNWLETILINSQFYNSNNKIAIKVQLIGIVDNLDNEIRNENDNKVQIIIEQCQKTLNNILKCLKNEIFSNNNNNENEINKLDQMIDRLENQIIINSTIQFIDFKFKKQNLNTIIKCFESETIKLNKKAPLKLRNIIKDHKAKLKLKKININTLMESFENNQELIQLINEQMNEKTQQTGNKKVYLNGILNYARNIGELFFAKPFSIDEGKRIKKHELLFSYLILGIVNL